MDYPPIMRETFWKCKNHLFTALRDSNMDRCNSLCDMYGGPVAPSRNPPHHPRATIQVNFLSLSSSQLASVKSISGSHLSQGNRALLIGPTAESCQSLWGELRIVKMWRRSLRPAVTPPPLLAGMSAPFTMTSSQSERRGIVSMPILTNPR